MFVISTKFPTTTRRIVSLNHFNFTFDFIKSTMILPNYYVLCMRLWHVCNKMLALQYLIITKSKFLMTYASHCDIKLTQWLLLSSPCDGILTPTFLIMLFIETLNKIYNINILCCNCMKMDKANVFLTKFLNAYIPTY